LVGFAISVEGKAPYANMAGLAQSGAVKLRTGVGMVDEDVVDLRCARDLQLAGDSGLTVV